MPGTARRSQSTSPILEEGVGGSAGRPRLAWLYNDGVLAFVAAKRAIRYRLEDRLLLVHIPAALAKVVRWLHRLQAWLARVRERSGPGLRERVLLRS